MLSILPSPGLLAGPAAALGTTTDRKRLAVRMEDSDDINQSTLNKRSKLHTDETVEIMADNVRSEIARRNPSMVSAEIRRAINNHKNGLDQEYHEIVEAFETLPNPSRDSDSSQIRQYLSGLANSANLLDSRCSELVHSILSYRWLSCYDDVLINVYLYFLKNLASLQSGYTYAILDMLVRNFAQLSSMTDQAGDISPTRHQELQLKVHLALEQLLQQIPSAIVPLMRSLTSNFPHPAQSRKTHVGYVRNMLKVTDYAPALESDILDLIIARLVSIDVKVQVDVEEYDFDIEDEAESTQQMQESLGEDSFRADSFPYDSDSEVAESDVDEDLDAEELRSQEIRSYIKKVDAIMDLLFAFLNPKFAPVKDETQMDSAFSQLITHFNKTMLPTYRSRHTQFLMFHFAQKSSGLVIRFIDACAAVLKQKSAPSVFRISAAAYIASFTARATHLSHGDVSYIFDTLTNYLASSKCEREPVSVSFTTDVPSLQKNPSYYSTFQALLYLFCFRWRDLLAEPDAYVEDDRDLFDGNELTWATGVREIFQSNIFSKLNPLKICAPGIVEEFARIAHDIKFLYVYQVLDSNKRIRLTDATTFNHSLDTRETSLSGLRGDRPHQLDAYFPFDPYRLPISRRWLRGDYNEWNGVPDHQSERHDDVRATSPT